MVRIRTVGSRSFYADPETVAGSHEGALIVVEISAGRTSRSHVEGQCRIHRRIFKNSGSDHILSPFEYFLCRFEHDLDGSL